MQNYTATTVLFKDSCKLAKLSAISQLQYLLYTVVFSGLNTVQQDVGGCSSLLLETKR